MIKQLLLLVLLATALTSHGMKANVMLRLDTVNMDGTLNDENSLRHDLSQLASGGVDGVMVDVWWGIVERNSAKNYNFNAYTQIASICKQYGLSLQVVMSFHRCGGNVGDDCDIPLPDWVLSAGYANDLFFKDQWNNVDDEYLSPAADSLRVFGGRTAVDCYSDMMSAFKTALQSYIDDGTLTEVQIGVGPCGELRYPSYPSNMWNFPGVGAFQCWDSHALDDFKYAAAQAGHSEWDSPPTDAGGYNSYPDQTTFFTDGYKSEYGEFFLNWYQQRIIDHGDRVGSAARTAFGNNMKLAIKIAGIHWWYGHVSHAAELTAGYHNIYGNDGYKPFADMFQKHGITFDFTCLEMKDSEQDSNYDCMPYELVRQTQDDVAKSGLGSYSGENALERYDSTAYDTIISQMSYKPEQFLAITYLRLSDTLMYDGGSWNTFTNFVNRVHNL
eukprot:gnl/Dysnectes_brevis/1405_a1584_3085.p1 GENE.gnl/Dysnectes_brevis/1405_a1584_3085~~gnl/Dysnectes_brevis/1405_a1584_3085.p1  ORF type:complete len:455 (+),score=141.98 gnl/Dysnectes_brevis/1405_a1584_3085:38-1366(+)